MYEVHVWNELQGDFITFKKDGKNFITADFDEAAEIAHGFIEDNVQAKVMYVRRQFVNPQRKKRPRAGRITRIQTTIWAGERVKVIPVNSQLKVIRLKKGQH